MRDRRDVRDRGDFEARRLQRPYRRFAAGTGTLDEDLDLLEAVFHGAPCRRFRRHLGSERRALARALETLAAGATPGQHVALRVRQRDHGVIEGGLDMRLADRDVLLFSTAGANHFLLWHGLLLCLDLLAHADRLARAATGARIRPCTLAANRKATPVTQAPVGSDLDQSLDVEGDLAPELAFDLGFLIADVPETPGGMGTDPKDIGERDLDALLTRNVNAGDTRHLPS